MNTHSEAIQLDETKQKKEIPSFLQTPTNRSNHNKQQFDKVECENGMCRVIWKPRRPAA